jgi:hypothetical protein
MKFVYVAYPACAPGQPPCSWLSSSSSDSPHPRRSPACLCYMRTGWVTGVKEQIVFPLLAVQRKAGVLMGSPLAAVQQLSCSSPALLTAIDRALVQTQGSRWVGLSSVTCSWLRAGRSRPHWRTWSLLESHERARLVPPGSTSRQALATTTMVGHRREKRKVRMQWHL